MNSGRNLKFTLELDADHTGDAGSCMTSGRGIESLARAGVFWQAFSYFDACLPSETFIGPVQVVFKFASRVGELVTR